MNEKELIQAIGELIDEKIGSLRTEMNERFDKIELRLDKLEDDAAITREGVNTLLDWADKAQTQVKIPLLPIAE